MEYQQLEQRSASVKAAEDGYSRKFNLRIPPLLREWLAIAARAKEKIIRLLAQEALERKVAA
jgi:predicted HicB family RNase H-like nuclease